MRRLDELYVRKDDRQDIQNYENHSGVNGYLASHKSSAICWRYQKAKGITKRGQHPLKGAVLFVYPQVSAMAFAIAGNVLLLAFALAA